MSGYVCHHCSTGLNIYGSSSGERLAQEMNVPFLGRIPIDPAVVTTGDKGVDFLEQSPGSPAATAIVSLAERIPKRAEQEGNAAEAVTAATEVTS